MNVPLHLKVLPAFLALVFLVSAQAADLTWVVNSGSTPPRDGGALWNTSLTNWYTSGSNVQWNNSNNYTAVIGSGGTAGEIDMNAAITVGGIIFNTVTGTYSITSQNGSELTMASSSTITVNDDAARILIKLAGTNGFTKSGMGNLIFTSGNSFSNYSGTTSVLDGSLTFQTGSVLRLNTNLVIGGGSGTATVNFNSASGLASTGTATINNNGILNLNENVSDFSNPVTIVVNDGGVISASTARIAYVKSLTFKDGADSSDTDVTFAFAASGTVVNISGAGSSATLIASNIFLQNNIGNRTFTVDDVVSGAGVDATISGTISGGSDTLVKAGLGTLRLSGTNTYQNTSITAGTLQVAKTASLPGYTTSGRISLTNAGSTLALNVGGTGEFDSTAVGQVLTNVTFAANTVLGFDTTNAAGGVFAYSGSIGGSKGISKVGSGTLTLSGSNAYTGLTAINGGVLALGNANALVGTGTITFGGGTLQYSGSNTVDYSSKIIGSGSTILIDTNGQSVTYASALVSSNTGGLTKIGTGTLTLSGAAANTYTGTTTVSAGELALSKSAGTTAITGNVRINGGTLRLVNSNQIADTSAITMSSGAFNLNGQTETITSFTNSGGVFSTGTNGRLTGTGATITWSGGTNTINSGGSVDDGHIVITGGVNTVEASGTLRLNTSGTLEMTGATLTLNSSSGTAGTLLLGGNVIVHASGTSYISNDLALANPGLVNLNGGTRTFTVEEGAALNVSARIDNGGLVKSGTGVLQLSAANTYSGTTTVNQGTLVAAAAGSLGSTGGITVNSGGTLLVGASGAVKDDTAITLAGGTLGASAAVTETLGALTLTSSSVLDFGAGAWDAAFTFEHLTLNEGVTFSIWNWTQEADHVFVTGGAANFTGSLSNISFYSGSGGDSFLGTASWGGVGNNELTIVAVPEPATIICGLALLGFLIWKENKRMKNLCSFAKARQTVPKESKDKKVL